MNHETYVAGAFADESLFTLPSTLIAQSRGLKKVQVGVPAISMGNIVIYFTKEAKIFEKHGLDVEPVAVAGSGIASKALISGSVQISPIATPTVMSSVLAGSDMVILAHTMPGVIQYLMARSDIKRTEDIKGKTIGVTTFGSLTDFLVKYLAKQKGLNPDKDFAMLQIGSDSDRFIAMQQGRIPMATLSHPNYFFAQRAGFHVLWDFFKEVDYPWSEIATTRTQIKQDRDLVMRYMRAHVEGHRPFQAGTGVGQTSDQKNAALERRCDGARIMGAICQAPLSRAVSKHQRHEDQLRICRGDPAGYL